MVATASWDVQRTGCEMGGPPIDLLLVTWNFPPKMGGMENLMFSLYDYLRRENRVVVIAPFGPTVIEHSEICRAPIPGFVFFCFYSLVKGLHICLTRKPRVVMGGSLVVAPILCMIKRFCSVRFFAYAHGLDVIYPSPLYQWLLRRCVPELTGVVCNSDNTRQLMHQRFPEILLRVIPPGVDVDRYGSPTVPCIAGRYMLSVGRLTERKGLIPFIQNCFVKIAEELEDLKLVIVGSDPKDAMAHQAGYKKRILACLREEGLENRVMFMGSVPEETLISLYQHCEALVLPVIPVEGDVEGFGIVAIEAVAAGRPVVAFNEGGISDAVSHGETGFLVPAGDYETMTKALLSILHRKHSFPPLMRQSVERKYGWRILVDQYKQFLFSASL
jgi:phosphatidyl-myo-inositol dimannoside synthase